MLRFYDRVIRAPVLYNTHRAVIFEIAQLSCYVCITTWTIMHYVYDPKFCGDS